MKVIYTSDGILVEVQTSNNPYLKETFKKGWFSSKVSSKPLATEDALALAIATIAKRLETCDLSEMNSLISKLEKVEDLYEKWYEDEQKSW